MIITESKLEALFKVFAKRNGRKKYIKKERNGSETKCCVKRKSVCRIYTLVKLEGCMHSSGILSFVCYRATVLPCYRAETC